MDGGEECRRKGKRKGSVREKVEGGGRHEEIPGAKERQIDGDVKELKKRWTDRESARGEEERRGGCRERGSEKDMKGKEKEREKYIKREDKSQT